MTFNLPNFRDTALHSTVDLLDFKPALTNRRYVHPSEFVSMEEKPDEAWAGVYFLIDTGFNVPNWGVVYVGESTNMGFRIAGHKSDKKFDKICFIYCDDRKKRKWIEECYTYYLKPKYNKQIPMNEPDGMADFCKGW